MLADALEIIEGSRLAKSLQRLGIGYMGGVCRRIPRSDFELVSLWASALPCLLSLHSFLKVSSNKIVPPLLDRGKNRKLSRTCYSSQPLLKQIRFVV